MKSLVKVTKVFIGILLFTNVIGCSEHNNNYLKGIVYNVTISNCYMKYPITLRYQDSLGKDEMFSIITDSDNLYSMLNIRAIDYSIFCQGIYLSAINSSPIRIDDQIYKYFVNQKIVSSPQIELLYNKDGIIGVLNKYLDNDGWLLKYFYNDQLDDSDFQGKGVNIDYIIYLAAKHNIYFVYYDFHLPDEYIGYRIALSSSDKKELRGLKAIEIF